MKTSFEPNTPLHDGAVVVRGDRVIAAACLLRLSDTTGVGRDLGTRHRAGLGVSEISDAKVFIVSEETGIISMAEGGRLVRHLDEASLRQILHGIYDAQDKRRPRAAAAFQDKGGRAPMMNSRPTRKPEGRGPFRKLRRMIARRGGRQAVSHHRFRTGGHRLLERAGRLRRHADAAEGLSPTSPSA